MKRRWISFISTLIISGGIIWSFSYLRDIHPLGSLAARLDQSGMNDISMRFKGIRLIGKSKGKMLWEFKADTIEVSHDRQKAIFKKHIQGSLIDNGKPTAAIKADEIIYGVYTHNIVSPGNAHINIQNGPSLTARNLYWNEYKSKLICSGGVDAHIGGSALHGDHMSVDMINKEILINKVNGEFQLDHNQALSQE